MEKEKKLKKIEVPEINVEQDLKIPYQVEKDFAIFNFRNAQEVADTIYSSIANTLLDGNLIFAYKSTSEKSELGQVVVVQFDNPNFNCFGVSIFKKSYSCIIPRVPVEYLDEVRDELKEGKVEKTILATYDRLVEDIKNRVLKDYNTSNLKKQ